MAKDSIATQIARIDERTVRMAQDMADVKTTLQQDYVTQDQFEPVKKLVYGLVSLILITVVGAILALVIVKPH